MKMRLLVLTSLISTAGLVDSAIAMNGKVDEKPIEDKKSTIKCFTVSDVESRIDNNFDVVAYEKNGDEIDLNTLIRNLAVSDIESVVDNNFEKKGHEIDLNTLIRNLTVSDVKSRVDNNFEKKGHEIDLDTLIHNLTKNKFDKIREYLEYRKNKDIEHLHNELNTDDFTSIFRHCNHPKYITHLLTKNEATTVSNYIQHWLTTYFTLKKLAKAANFFGIELAYIKNLHIRRIFAHELVKHLRSIITTSTTGNIADQFDDIKEGLAKWAIRLVYNEVMTATNTPFIDNMHVVRQINNAIVQESDIWVCTIDLSLSSLNNRQQLEKFLLQAHEILEPLFGCEITKIYLSNNQLTQVPDFNLPNLQYLSLYNNLLTQVPNFNLPNLQYLSFYNNLLTQVPNFNLPNLKELYLAYNQLTQAPNFNLPNLKSLSLTNNQLTQVPNFNLPNLKWLHLTNNQLTQVPNFNNLPNLQELYLYNNQLTQVPNFNNLPNLQKIDLHDNLLNKKPVFTNLPNNCNVAC